MTGRAALALTLALTGCFADIGADEDLTDTGFISPLNPHVIANGMQLSHILGNGIMATDAGMEALRQNSLSNESFDPALGPPELAGLLPSAENQVFIRHLVECALDPTMSVTFQGIKYQGAAGLAPRWNKDKPTQEDLEAVSGCIIALNNSIGLSVILSLRGMTVAGDPLSIDGLVRSFAYGPQVTATPLPSFFASCSPFETGAGRNCGWLEDQAFVGTCTKGHTVHVGAGARVGDCGSPLGFSNGNTVLRACKGLRGCDVGSADHLKSADNTCGTAPAVKFTCPADGTFNVMLAGVKQGTPFSGEMEADSDAAFEFPTKAPTVFPYIEGAFYGDITDPKKRNPNVRVVLEGGRNGPVIVVGKGDKKHTGLGDPVVFPFDGAFGCFDPAWSDIDAYATGRFCVTVSVQPEGGGAFQPQKFCLAQNVGPCNVVPVDDPNNVCQRLDQDPVQGDFDHDDCIGLDGNLYKYPFTVFLHEPCDLIKKKGGKDDASQEGQAACKRK